jgi:hypothetical protein
VRFCKLGVKHFEVLKQLGDVCPGLYRIMDDMKNQLLRDTIDREVQKLKSMTADQEAAFFHQQRLHLGR